MSASSALLSDGDSLAAPITVLAVGDDAAGRERVGARLDGVGDIRVEMVATATVPTHLDAADCVVCDGDVPDADLLELIATVRRREPTLPFVLLANAPSRDIVDAVCEIPWTDCLGYADDVGHADLLVQRVRDIVGYRRTTALARRALAAVERATDAIALVAPDGTLEFVNPLFARQIGTTPEALIGRNWRSCYPDSAVARLESDAFPSLADGWRWIGDCEMRRDDGSTFVAQTRIDALDDDCLVVTVSDRPTDGD